jgi:hypothetical protein
MNLWGLSHKCWGVKIILKLLLMYRHYLACIRLLVSGSYKTKSLLLKHSPSVVAMCIKSTLIKITLISNRCVTFIFVSKYCINTVTLLNKCLIYRWNTNPFASENLHAGTYIVENLKNVKIWIGFVSRIKILSRLRRNYELWDI